MGKGQSPSERRLLELLITDDGMDAIAAIDETTKALQRMRDRIRFLNARYSLASAQTGQPLEAA